MLKKAEHLLWLMPGYMCDNFYFEKKMPWPVLLLEPTVTKPAIHW